MHRSAWALIGFSMAFLSSQAAAGIANGDFESGASGWTLDPVPSGWSAEFIPSGGNPGGFFSVQSAADASTGQVCIRQTFDCGSLPGSSQCVIDFDYRVEVLDGQSITGVVQVEVDGNPIFIRGINSVGVPWTRVERAVGCGTHDLAVCAYDIYDGNGWRISFDNYQAQCDPIVPTQRATWGRLRATYR